MTADAPGSVIAVYDSSRAVVGRNVYDEYGKPAVAGRGAPTLPLCTFLARPGP